MDTLRIAYFDQLGQKKLLQAKNNFNQMHPNVNVELIGMGHDDVFTKLENNQVDLAINDLRDEKNDFSQKPIAQLGVKAILPKGSYPNGMQMVEKNELGDLTCFIVAKPEEEVAELHLFKDFYQIPSHFIAANSVEEAALLVASGSGYFLMNEDTAQLIRNEDLQGLFLLNDGQQIRQKITAFYLKQNDLIDNFIAILQKKYQFLITEKACLRDVKYCKIKYESEYNNFTFRR